MSFLGGVGGALGGTTKGIIGKLAITAFEGNGIASMVNQALAGMTSAFGGIAGSMAPAAGAGIASALKGISPGAIDKMLYMAALNGALKKAADSNHFNLETHINDLWLKLSQIRQSQSDAQKLQELITRNQEAAQMLSNMLQKLHQASTSAAQNIKG